MSAGRHEGRATALAAVLGLVLALGTAAPGAAEEPAAGGAIPAPAHAAPSEPLAGAQAGGRSAGGAPGRSAAALPTPEELEAAWVQAVGPDVAAGPPPAPRAAQKPRPTMWVASRALPRGHVLSSRDLARAPRHGALPDDALRDPGSAVGQRLRRGVRPGTPLRQAMLEPAPAVRRGARVRLVLARGALRIEGRGRARHDARAGEWVRVLNVDSRREVVGRAGDDGVVYVGD